jgi:hypothetical protein
MPGWFKKQSFKKTLFALPSYNIYIQTLCSSLYTFFIHMYTFLLIFSLPLQRTIPIPETTFLETTFLTQ